MELNDVVYLILMLAFVVFGIFNDSKKKKQDMGDSTNSTDKKETNVRDVFRELFEKIEQRDVPPPMPKQDMPKRMQPSREKRFKQSHNPMAGFESSMSLVTDFEGESSLKGYNFAEMSIDESITKESEKQIHPLIHDIIQADNKSELQKAILYSEILKRKY